MNGDQHTLDGDIADRQTKPALNTMRYCHGCGNRVLKSRWNEHVDHHREAVESDGRFNGSEGTIDDQMPADHWEEYHP